MDRHPLRLMAWKEQVQGLADAAAIGDIRLHLQRRARDAAPFPELRHQPVEIGHMVADAERVHPPGSVPWRHPVSP